MSVFKVIAGAVVLATEAGSERYFYRGATIDEAGFDQARIEHAVDVGLIEKIEPEAEAEEAPEIPAKAETDAEPKPPAASSSDGEAESKPEPAGEVEKKPTRGKTSK